MIYKSNNIYYLKKGSGYEIANIEIKYSRTKKKNIIVISSSGIYFDEIAEPIEEYTFKELENILTR